MNSPQHILVLRRKEEVSVTDVENREDVKAPASPRHQSCQTRIPYVMAIEACRNKNFIIVRTYRTYSFKKACITHTSCEKLKINEGSNLTEYQIPDSCTKLAFSSSLKQPRAVFKKKCLYFQFYKMNGKIYSSDNFNFVQIDFRLIFVQKFPRRTTFQEID